MRRFLSIALPPFALAAAAATCTYGVAGPGLGLYLGGIALAMVLTPPLVLAHRARINQLLAAASVVDGVGVVWLVAMVRSDVTFAQWLAAYVLLAACLIAVTGLAVALARYATRDVFAAALTAIMALAWLSWPIWLSAWVDRAGVVRAIDRLVPVHPLLTANGLLVHLGVWGEQRLMYRLTSLGQDVPYSLPSSVALCAGVHLLIGASLLLLSGSRRDVGAAVDVPD